MFAHHDGEWGSVPMGDVMRCLMLFACLSVFVAGCGESDRNDMSLEDISGVWENTVTYVDSGTGEIYEDEAYVVIQPDGTYRRYDYKGDTHDRGSSCYDVSELGITPEGGGDFTLSAGVVIINTIHVERVQGGMLITYDGKTLTLLETELIEPDFIPLCDEQEQYDIPIVDDSSSTIVDEPEVWYGTRITWESETRIPY